VLLWLPALASEANPAAKRVEADTRQSTLGGARFTVLGGWSVEGAGARTLLEGRCRAFTWRSSTARPRASMRRSPRPGRRFDPTWIARSSWRGRARLVARPAVW